MTSEPGSRRPSEGSRSGVRMAVRRGRRRISVPRPTMHIHPALEPSRRVLPVHLHFFEPPVRTLSLLRFSTPFLLAAPLAAQTVDTAAFGSLTWRNIGP